VTTPEWQLLKLVALAGDDASAQTAAEFAVAGSLDPDRLVGLAARHNLAPALASFQQWAEGAGLLKGMLPVGSRRMLRDAWIRNRQRTEAFVAEAARVAGALRERDIAVAVTKGTVAQATVYGGGAVRVFSDVDLMVALEAAEQVGATLQDLGYRSAMVFDHATGTAVPIPRGDVLAYRYSPDHLPHLLRLTPGEVVSHVVLDVAMHFLWHDAPWNVPVGEALRQRVHHDVGYGVSLPALDPVHDFLFLCLHVFREGWRIGHLARKDVKLAQFADVARHWPTVCAGREDDIGKAIHNYGLRSPIAWVTGHTDALFGTDLTARLGLTAVANPAWLNSACRSAGTYLAWTGTMDDRLQAHRPPAMSPAGDPRDAA
jgi:hypothetical protein